MLISITSRLRYPTSQKSVVDSTAAGGSEPNGDITQDIPPEFEANIESGFQIATFQGPLCAEPMEGLAFFVESIEFDASQLGTENSTRYCHSEIGYLPND